MERILWLDGSVTLINAEEAYENTHTEASDTDFVHVLVHNGFAFEWHNNMWVQR